MTAYLISATVLGLISGVALHLSHRELLPAVRCAAGILLLSFVILPIGSMISAVLDFELPDISYGENSVGGVAVTGEEAFCDGIALALSERFGAKRENFSVSCRGFKLESLSADKVHIVASGGAALLDYRMIENYIEESLEVRECECEIKIG